MSVYRVGTNKSSTNVFPSIRPSLDLDFANTKTLDPRITFTRASGGTYVGADGLIKYAGVNEARFDHDPETGESLGLLVEEARANSLLKSEEFDNAYWDKTRSSIGATKVLAPDGSITGAELIEDTSANTHQLRRAISFTSGVAYTISIFAKATASPRFFQILFPNAAFSSNRRPYFDVVNGTATADIDTTVQIQPFGNGWYRCSATMTATITASAVFVYQLSDEASTANPPYTGDNVSGLYVWGAQLEAQAFLSSYIPTQGSTRTRARDSAVITGKNFSSWYRQDEGTVFAEYARFAPNLLGTSRRLFEITEGTVNNRITTSVGTGVFIANAFITKDGAGQLSPSFTQINMDSFGGKSALAFKNNNFSYSYKTQPLLRSFVGSIPEVMIQANIGSAISPSTLTQANGCISRLTYYPKRLPDQQLRALTR
jgi:hypothetical protein